MDELAQLPGQFATLKVDVEYIKRDVSEIKVGLQGMNEKLDTLDARIHQNEKSLLHVEKSLIERIDGVDRRLIEKFGEISFWVMGLHVALAAGLLLVMAKGFKWI